MGKMGKRELTFDNCLLTMAHMATQKKKNKKKKNKYFKTWKKKKKKKLKKGRAVVAHAFSPRTWEAEAGRFLNSRPAWSTK